jgi:thiamine transport system permease protein
VAVSLGASQWQVFRQITLVKLKSSILQSLLLCFFYCSSSFIIILMLGGSPRFSSLETAIYQAVKIDLDISVAVLLAVIQLGVCVCLQLLQKPKREMLMVSQGKERQTLFEIRGQRVRLWVTVCLWLVILGLLLFPLTHLAVSGLGGFFKLDWLEFSSVFFRSIGLSVIVGCVATLLSFCGAYIVQHLNNSFIKQAVYFTTSLPVALSTMVTGLAIIVTFARTDWFRNQMVGVVWIQALSILPMGFRVLNERFTKIEMEIYRTAQSLGTTKWQQLNYIELPFLRRAISLVWATGVGISLGESGSVLLFESQGRPTLTLWLFKLMGKYRFEEAFTVGLTLLILTASIFWVREKWLNLH